MKRNGWVVISLVCLAASIVSLFTTVIVYTDGGMRTTYNIIDLILYQDFADSVLSYYSGQAFLGISDGLVAVLAVIGVAAIICSLIGIITMQGKAVSESLALCAGAGGSDRNHDPLCGHRSGYRAVSAVFSGNHLLRNLSHCDHDRHDCLHHYRDLAQKKHQGGAHGGEAGRG